MKRLLTFKKFLAEEQQEDFPPAPADIESDDEIYAHQKVNFDSEDELTSSTVGNTSNFAKLISVLFGARDHAHQLHLATKSYAEHVALNELYDLLLAFADELAEMYQGKFGLLNIKATSEEISGETGKEFLEALVAWLENAKGTLVGDNTSIINKYEELLGDVYRVKYKIDNFA